MLSVATWIYRLTLSRRLWRFWRRCKIWCYNTASAIVYIPAAVYRHLTALWLAHTANIKARTDLKSAPPEAKTNAAVDATEHPILMGVVAADYHDKVE